MQDILAKILHIVAKRSNFNLHAASSWLLYFSLPFQYNLATIGVLEFVVVIDVYAQPTREKIKFYRTASYSKRTQTTFEEDVVHSAGGQRRVRLSHGRRAGGVSPTGRSP